jgi:DNA modification methylase
MEYEQIDIESVKEADYNPRKISEKDFNNLKKSIKEHGQLRPLIINKNSGNLISGHQMLKVAKELNWKKLDVIYKELSIEQEKALNIAMNKISGQFDEDKLIDLLMDIDEKNEDLLGSTGFSTEEINYLLGLKERDKEDMFAVSVEDEYTGKNKYGIQEGDIIKLDNHTIICGDSSKIETWQKLIGDNKIDLIITSPPYNLDISYGKYQDKQPLNDYLKMIKQVFENGQQFMKKGRYICNNIGREWGPINMPAKYDQIFEELGYTFFRNIYWKKPSGSARGTITTRNPFPRYYVPKVQTEIIQIYANEEQPELINQMITYKYGDSEKLRKEQIPNILLNKFAGNVWEMMTETTLSGDHPAPFPIDLPFNCIRFFTFENENVLDCFHGSGSSMIASDQLNRKYYGIDIDPDYISLSIERFLMYKPNTKMEIIHGN